MRLSFLALASVVGLTLSLGAGCSGSSLGSSSCAQLMDAYSAAVPAALACDPGAPNQCQQPAPALSCNCGGVVQDATQLDEIAAELRASGCVPTHAYECPCPYEGPVSCVAGDGGGTCTTSFPPHGG